MSFTTAVSTCFGKYATFGGRARRSEYWWFTLCWGVSLMATMLIGQANNTLGTVLMVAVYLVFLLPGLAVAVRRLHDTGRSGWWYLLSLVPFGGLVLLVFMVQDSQPGPNQFGESPKPAFAVA